MTELWHQKERLSQQPMPTVSFPRTGSGSSRRISVTVILPRCMGRFTPFEEGIGKQIFTLMLANTFSRIGYYSRTFYYTLGCNTAFRKDAFVKAGMYRCIDAGDDLEIALRMKDQGKVVFDNRLKVGFSMRRYKQFGTMQSLYEWIYIVSHGGQTEKYSYTQKKYK